MAPEQERRKEPRLPARGVFAHLCHDGRSVPCRIQNICSGGLALFAGEPVAAPAEVWLNLAMPGWTRVLTLRGRVVESSDSAVRIQLHPPPQETAALLTALLHALKAEDQGATPDEVEVKKALQPLEPQVDRTAARTVVDYPVQKILAQLLPRQTPDMLAVVTQGHAPAPEPVTLLEPMPAPATAYPRRLVEPLPEEPPRPAPAQVIHLPPAGKREPRKAKTEPETLVDESRRELEALRVQVAKLQELHERNERELRAQLAALQTQLTVSERELRRERETRESIEAALAEETRARESVEAALERLCEQLAR